MNFFRPLGIMIFAIGFLRNRKVTKDFRKCFSWSTSLYHLCMPKRARSLDFLGFQTKLTSVQNYDSILSSESVCHFRRTFEKKFLRPSSDKPSMPKMLSLTTDPGFQAHQYSKLSESRVQSTAFNPRRNIQ